MRASAEKPWFLYLIECEDNSIYTGITVNVAERFTKHQSGKAARYTRSHPPKKLLAVLACQNQSQALKMERWVKTLSPHHKRELADYLFSADRTVQQTVEDFISDVGCYQNFT